MKLKHVLLGLGVLAAAGILYWGLSPLLRNIVVDDALPPGALPMARQDGQAASPQATTTGESENTLVNEGESGNTAQVVGTIGHPASGTVRLLAADGKTYVRYEGFKTINGPDLYVYLAKDLDAREFVDLGRIRGTEGNINYEVPAHVDPREYRYVLTWCRAFSVLFNYAEVN